MRKLFVFASFLVLACSAAAIAGVPDPLHSSSALSVQPLACQWRFRNDGGLDALTLKVTVRDFTSSPIANCTTFCSLDGASVVAKSCGGNQKGARTDLAGTVNFIFRCIGGHGRVTLHITQACSGKYEIAPPQTFTFTNPDLSGSRDTDNGATNVVDLGIWAGGISPYGLASDFDCNGAVNVIDLGLFATGIGTTCSNCP